MSVSQQCLSTALAPKINSKPFVQLHLVAPFYLSELVYLNYFYSTQLMFPTLNFYFIASPSFLKPPPSPLSPPTWFAPVSASGHLGSHYHGKAVPHVPSSQVILCVPLLRSHCWIFPTVLQLIECIAQKVRNHISFVILLGLAECLRVRRYLLKESRLFVDEGHTQGRKGVLKIW